MKVLESITMIGAGRRSNRTVLDQLLQFDAAELELSGEYCKVFTSLLSCLASIGLDPSRSAFEVASPQQNPLGVLCNLYGQTALLIQQRVGHRVSFSSFTVDSDLSQACVFIEYEERNVGEQAAALALDIVNASCTDTDSDDDASDFHHRLQELRKMAKPLILPIDAEMLINAAKSLDIPCAKLERDPYEGVQGDFRILNNSMLMLGHACHQQIVDGNLCLNRSASVLTSMRDRIKILQLMQSFALPVPGSDSHPGRCGSVARAVRSANRIAYPVVVKPVIARQGGVSVGISDEASLEQAVEQALQISQQVLIESHIEGKSYKIISAGQRIIAVVDAQTGQEVTRQCHKTICEAAARMVVQLPLGMLVLTFVTTDLSAPLEISGGAFVNFDAAPELNRFLSKNKTLHRDAALAFVRWIFPADSPARIPVFSVTGTNGKTTTCRMLATIAKTAGFKVGMACTDGVYINDQHTEVGDKSGSVGHMRVFESRDINLAVLETARGAVANSGFLFDYSDVAICTNVTAEHLGEYGIESVEQMADLKQLVLQRARIEVVINADDPQGRRMALNAGERKVCLCSLNLSLAEVEQQVMNSHCYCLLESRNGEQWVVMHDAGKKQDVMPLGDIPATFDGTARHNVSNAMQAIAAALLMGMDLAVVRSAMTVFEMDIESTPGRLNFFHGLPFPVLMDFVQNPDGMRSLCEFTRSIDVTGRRILVISVLGRHDDEVIRQFAQIAAQHFDYFICRNYGVLFERVAGEVPELLRKYLLESGVADAAISIIPEEVEALDAALKMASKDDLLTFMCGNEPQRSWQQISEFARTQNGSPAIKQP